MDNSKPASKGASTPDGKGSQGKKRKNREPEKTSSNIYLDNQTGKIEISNVKRKTKKTTTGEKTHQPKKLEMFPMVEDYEEPKSHPIIPPSKRLKKTFNHAASPLAMAAATPDSGPAGKTDGGDKKGKDGDDDETEEDEVANDSGNTKDKDKAAANDKGKKNNSKSKNKSKTNSDVPWISPVIERPAEVNVNALKRLSDTGKHSDIVKQLSTGLVSLANSGVIIRAKKMFNESFLRSLNDMGNTFKDVPIDRIDVDAEEKKLEKLTDRRDEAAKQGPQAKGTDDKAKKLQSDIDKATKRISTMKKRIRIIFKDEIAAPVFVAWVKRHRRMVPAIAEFLPLCQQDPYEDTEPSFGKVRFV